MPRARSIALLVGLLVLCFAVAAIGGVSTAEGIREWYPTLDKPPWTPPNWAFGPIWTTLYTLMAVSAWLIARTENPGSALGFWGLQLAFNAAWSPIFFAWQQTGLALVVITALWAAIVATIVTFRSRSGLAAALLAPYLAWVTLAWTLNAWIWWFNG
ncbi:MAG: TspO/MBR family protein [Myxococcota bacterium]